MIDERKIKKIIRRKNIGHFATHKKSDTLTVSQKRKSF